VVCSLVLALCIQMALLPDKLAHRAMAQTAQVAMEAQQQMLMGGLHQTYQHLVIFPGAHTLLQLQIQELAAKVSRFLLKMQMEILIGSLTAGTGTKLVGNDKYVEHSAAKSTDPAIWTFDWTAPTTGVGDVTFYGAFVSGKPNVSLEAVTISQNTASLFVENNNFQMQIFPNPVIENINIQFSLDTPERVSINLISLEGKRVKTLC
jgi:hypothetical protein